MSLCFHLKRDALLCHHCDATLTPPFICPGCGSESHRYSGVGTERVEAELHRLLPSIKCLRMDADTTRQKHSHWRILDDFKARKAQVLLGTQMIAKGLDIPSVTLVGVINADTSLALPDFRAAERTFQLLTQVSGRAGRGELPGRVIIQTFSPENYAIESCVRGDDEGFYLHELAWRREAGYPPFLQVVNLVFTSPREEAALQACPVHAGDPEPPAAWRHPGRPGAGRGSHLPHQGALPLPPAAQGGRSRPADAGARARPCRSSSGPAPASAGNTA